MTIIYSIEPLSGINLNSTTVTNTNSAGTAIPTFGPLGAQVFASNGKRYVFVKANGSIASNAAVVVSSTTFEATSNSSGTYTSIPGGLSSGEYAWVYATSV